jgi:hypothetical protein
MKSNIVAILLTFSLCPISTMGQGFSNFVGNKDRILTTDTVCNGRNKLVVDEVLTPVEEGRYKHTMRVFMFPGSERKKETIERMVGFQDRREELRWLRNHD